MEVFQGIAAFPGIAIGTIQNYHKNEYQIRHYTVSSSRRELERFARARKEAMKELQELYEKTCRDMGKQQALIFKKHMYLLEHSSFAKAIESLICTEKVNATYAVATTRDELAATFSMLEDEYVRERMVNIQELADRLIIILDGIEKEKLLGEEPVILAAQQLTPVEMMELGKEKVLAFVTENGSAVSHTSILAKTMNIPSIVNVQVQEEWNGKTAIVDGYRGTLILDPDEKTCRDYEKQQKEDQEERELLLKLRDARDITSDGKHIRLFANIGSLEDMESVLYYGAEGIGLLRSEFQYMGRENYPREGELFRAYKKIAETMGEKQVVIRTVDLGADLQADYMEIPEEANPVMGNRGIRLCLDRRRMFKAQLRAIYRASAYGNLAVLYPMITSMEEVREIQNIVEEVKEGLKKKDIPYKDIPNGYMIETPAAAMISRELAKEADFLSLGTNDLTQYTLAMDRQNPHIKKFYNDRHPALMRMIQMAIDAVHGEGKEIYICGELAADPTMTETFIQMGVDGLSVVPAYILPIRKEIRKACATGKS